MDVPGKERFMGLAQGFRTIKKQIRCLFCGVLKKTNIVTAFGWKVLLCAAIAAGAAQSGRAQATLDGESVLWHNAGTGELRAWLLDTNGKVTGFPQLTMTCNLACANDWKVVGT